jgi:hypothetical protein
LLLFFNFLCVTKVHFKAIKYPLTEDMILTGKVPLAADGAVKNDGNHQYWATFETQNGSQMERFPYQNFHNLYIKVRLYNDTSPAYLTGQTQGAIGKLLDLCSGKGVDITKIKKARYAEVVGIHSHWKSNNERSHFHPTAKTRK